MKIIIICLFLGVFILGCNQKIEAERINGEPDVTDYTEERGCFSVLVNMKVEHNEVYDGKTYQNWFYDNIADIWFYMYKTEIFTVEENETTGEKYVYKNLTKFVYDEKYKYVKSLKAKEPIAEETMILKQNKFSISNYENEPKSYKVMLRFFDVKDEEIEEPQLYQILFVKANTTEEFFIDEYELRLWPQLPEETLAYAVYIPVPTKEIC